jgi:uncharacterized phage-associated protein
VLVKYLSSLSALWYTRGYLAVVKLYEGGHSMKVSALDVAAYILRALGAMPAMKLQKLVYYSQAWALVWDDKPLFDDRIEAWANGPVVRRLYAAHRGEYIVSRIHGGFSRKLHQEQRETVDAVLKFYGDKSSQWLSDLTHMERPWREARARRGLRDGERGNAVIRRADMAEYYSSL